MATEIDPVRRTTKQGWLSTGPLSEAIRSAIGETIHDGVSIYMLASVAKIDVGTLGRFHRRECSLKLATAERLCEHLGISMAREPEGEKDAGPSKPTDALIAAIEARSLSPATMSRLSGITHTTITRFLGRLVGIDLISADRMAAALEMRIIRSQRPSISSPPQATVDEKRPIFDAIVATIQAEGLDASDIARDTGIRKAHLERLLERRGDAKLATIDRLCEHLELGFAVGPGMVGQVPSAAIRAAIESSGLGSRKIANLSSVVPQAIDGFRAGRVGLELISADRIAAALNVITTRGPVTLPSDAPALEDPSIPYQDSLRAAAIAARDRGLSVYAMSRLSGLSQPPIRRFLNGEVYLKTTSSIAKMAKAVGYGPWPMEPQLIAPETQPVSSPWDDWDIALCPVHVRGDNHLIVFGHVKIRLRSKNVIRLVVALADRYPAGGFDHPGLLKRFGTGAVAAFHRLKKIDADCDIAFQPPGVKNGQLYRIGRSVD